MQLMIYYTKAERFPEALSEIDVILRRNEELRPALLPELTKLVADPRGRAALATILARDPVWREDFFAAAGSAQARHERRPRPLRAHPGAEAEGRPDARAPADPPDPGRLRRLCRRPPDLALRPSPAGTRAATASCSTAPSAACALRGPSAGPSRTSKPGRAEPAKDGQRTYLDVAYFGGQNVALAEQMLALPPGRHILAPRRPKPQRNQLGQALLAADLPSGRQPDRSARHGPGRRRQPPVQRRLHRPRSGCPGQSLSLIAEPGDVATVVNLEIARMEIGQ